MFISLFIILAAICKAVSDTLTHHFDTSIFSRKDRKFWDPEFSWKYARKVFAYPVDAWHLFNSGMIVCFCLAVVFHRPVIWWGWELIIAGVLFNVTFNLMYNKILR